jgi:hypothetical protein
MADLNLHPAFANTLANSIIGALNGGTVKFYTGTQPADPSVAVTDQVLLGTLTLGAPCGSATDGLITFSAVGSDNAADASGTATWTRWSSSSDDARIDMAVGNNASNKPVKMNTTSVLQGGALQITSATLKVG